MLKPEGYKFDPKFDWWTPDHTKNYKWIADYFKDRAIGRITSLPLRMVEIGIFEGRSTIWFVENILGMKSDRGRLYFEGSQYFCVDPDPAPNFDHNLKLLKQRIPGPVVCLMEDYSENFLPGEIAGPKFDFLYLDGDHNAPGVLRDAVIGWELLKVGGLMLFDDYEMEATDPWHYISHKEFKDNPRANFRHPSHAIDAFLNVYRGLYDKVIDNFQVGIIKTVHLGAKNLNHGDESQGENGEGKFEYRASKE